jgi:hypothetical protein
MHSVLLRITLEPSRIIFVIHWAVAVVHPTFTIREGTIQVVVGRDPVSCLSRKVTMPVEKLFLVLMESLVRLSEHLLPRISIVLAVFHEAVIPLHHPSSVLQNCKNIGVNFNRTRKRERAH